MKSIDFINKVKEYSQKQNWLELSDLAYEINQSFVDSGNIKELVGFYDKVLESSFTGKSLLLRENKWIKKISNRKYGNFSSAVLEMLKKAKLKLNDNGSYKAIYLEYFFDGGDASTANLYLCSDFDEKDDDWASSFAKEGFIEGIAVNSFLDFDPNFKLNEVEEFIANQYADARLLAATIDAWNESKLSNYPFGFAKHDHRIIRLRK